MDDLMTIYCLRFELKELSEKADDFVKMVEETDNIGSMTDKNESEPYLWLVFETRQARQDTIDKWESVFNSMLVENDSDQVETSWYDEVVAEEVKEQKMA